MVGYQDPAANAHSRHSGKRCFLIAYPSLNQIISHLDIISHKGRDPKDFPAKTDGLAWDERVEWYGELQNCVNEDFTCIGEWSEKTEQPLTHVYISHTEEWCFILRNALEDSLDYVEVFQENRVIIFEQR